MTRLFFVTGTDTEVGKTYVAASLVRTLARAGQSIGVYKPVASGCRIDGHDLISDDAIQLWEAAGRPLSLEQVCPQRFAAPLAPPAAAAAEGQVVRIDQFTRGLDAWTARFDTVVVEGAGGFLSPLAVDFLNADFAKSIDAEVIIVAANRLGMINHTLLTVESCRNRLDRDPLAIMINDTCQRRCESVGTNFEQVERYAAPVTVAELGFQENLAVVFERQQELGVAFGLR